MVGFQTSPLVWRQPLSYDECVPKRYSNESLPKTFKFVLSSGECRHGPDGHSNAMSSPWESQLLFGEVFITISVSLQRTPQIFLLVLPIPEMKLMTDFRGMKLNQLLILFCMRVSMKSTSLISRLTPQVNADALMTRLSERSTSKAKSKCLHLFLQDQLIPHLIMQLEDSPLLNCSLTIRCLVINSNSS